MGFLCFWHSNSYISIYEWVILGHRKVCRFQLSVFQPEIIRSPNLGKLGDGLLKSIGVSAMSNIISVSFNNQTITAFMNNGEPVIAMKPIVENMGLAWNGQFEKIKRHPVMSKGIRVIRTPSNGGEQEVLCLPLKMLNGWLFGIDSSRVKAEIKDSVIAYQEKCFDVLAEYFGMAQKPQPTTEAPKALPNYREKLNKAVKNWVAVAKKNGSSMGYDDAWRIVHLKTGMLDGVELATQEQIQNALVVVGEAMQGEFIPRSTPQIEQIKEEPKPTTKPFSQPELYDESLLDIAFAIARMLVNLVPEQRNQHLNAIAKENNTNMQLLAMFTKQKVATV